MYANETFFDELRVYLGSGKYKWTILSLCSMVFWFFYLTFWNSRVFGLVLTFILRRFTNYNIKIGSLSLSVLGGKLMLRDFYIVNKDYSFRCFHIIIIFNYWKPYQIDKKDESDRSLSIYAFKPEFHLFNRTAVYEDLLKVVANVAEKRRLLTMASVKSSIGRRSNFMKQKSVSHEMIEYNDIKEKPVESFQWFDWHLLFPKIILQLESLTMCFGNHLLPTTFCLKSDKAIIKYTKKPPTHSIDRYQHYVIANCTSFVASLIPTINHKKLTSHRNKLKENQSCQILLFEKSKFIFEMDEPGEVTLEPEQLHMTNRNIEVVKTWPKYVLNIEVLKNCSVSYNAWADSQRDILWKFFFPQDFTTLKVTNMPQVGSNRIHKSFDIFIKSNNTKINLGFKEQHMILETNTKCYLDINIPWIITEAGYTSTIQWGISRSTLHLSHLSSDFLTTEEFEMKLDMNYPRVWNALQSWNFHLILNKGKCKLVYDYKNFFMDLINDWASDDFADVCKFVPFVYDFKIDISDSSFLLYANDYNWIAPSDENAYVAFKTQQALLHITLPFIDFLPDKVPYHIQINAGDVTCQLSIPETSTSLYIIKELHSYMRIVDNDCKPLPNDQLFKITTEFVKGQEDKPLNKRRKIHWIDCIVSPEVNVNIRYFHHPMHKIKNFWEFMPTEMVTKHPSVSIEEDPLSNLRPEGQLQMGPTIEFLKTSNFDASYMEPDLLDLNVKISSGIVCLYGSLLRHVLHIKENYFGENQIPTDFSGSQISAADQAKVIRSKNNNYTIVDPREYRPFSAKINLSAHNVQGHLMKHSSTDGTFCPTVFIDCIGFEMDKCHQETKLQVLCSPILIVVFDSYQERRDVAIPLNIGTLVMEGLQVRGHAMFTEGIIEYGWLLEITLGKLTGQCTVQQLNTLVHCIQCLIFLVTDQENEILPARDFEYCQHLWPKTECPEWQYKHRCLCPSEADVKYKLLRALFDGFHINIVEDSTCLALEVCGPVHIVNCNLHGPTTKEGISAILPEFSVKQYIKPLVEQPDSDNWLEAGSLTLGNVVLNAGIALPMLDYRLWQDNFLRHHDKKTKRLWFLWSDLQEEEQGMSTVCGCVGGCAFFGENFLNNRYSRSSTKASVNSEKAACFVNREVLGATKLLTFGESLFEKGKWIFERHKSEKCSEISCGWILLRETNEREEIIANIHNSSNSVSDSSERITIGLLEDEEPILNHSQTFSETPSNDNDSQLPIYENGLAKIKRKFSLKSLISCISSKSTEMSIHSHLSIPNSEHEKIFQSKIYQHDDGEDESSGEIRAKYVDLRGQLHKTITESNLLYTAYKRHLATYSCSKWAVPVILRNYWTKCHSERLAVFHCTQEGFNPKLVVMRSHHKRSARPLPQPDMNYVLGCCKKFPDHESLDSSTTDLTAKTTVSIKFNNSINVLLTPLFVECITRYVTILTPELSHSFTSTVVNRLHFQSVQLTQDRCKPMKGTSPDPDSMLSTKCASLKRTEMKENANKETDVATNLSENVFESASHWVQRKVTSVLVPNISGLTPLMEESSLVDQKKGDYTIINMEETPATPTDAKDYPDIAIDQSADSVGLTSPAAGEISRVKRTQFSVSIDRIYVCVMQLYAIEDIVNSDTLVSGLHDLTCVSLMSLCLDTASFQLLINSRSEVKHDLDTLIRALRELKKSKSKSRVQIDEINLANLNTKKFGTTTAKSISSNNMQDIDRFRKTEEIIANIEVKRVHGQLRRLTRDSQFSPDVLLTAIPFNTSKVFFSFESDPGGPLSHCVKLDERSAGWIMFECGLENLVLKGVRKRGFPDSVDDYSKKITDDDNSTDHSSENVDDTDDTAVLRESNIHSRSSRNALITHLQVRTLWLNFPAPKKLPNKKRINITRDDWNLLSTATPMIKAWMDPFYRLIRSCDKLKQLTERRQLAVLACLMTQISHVEISHFSNIMFGYCDKNFNFYNKWRTILARSIRYEPTCQIFTLIRMYLQSDANLIMEVERSLKDDTLPQTVTLQRGILALTRHWQHLVEVDPQLKISLFQNLNDPNNFNPMNVNNIQRMCSPGGLIHVPTATTQLLHYNMEEPCLNKSPESDEPHSMLNQDDEDIAIENPIMERFLQDTNKASNSKFMKDLNENSPTQFDFQLDPQDENEDNYPMAASFIPQTQYYNQVPSNDKNAAFVTNQFKQANFLRAHCRYMEEAQKFFRPLLEIVGLHVKGVRRTTLMKKFGGYFGATGLLESFKIDIITSESNPLSQYNKKTVETDEKPRTSDQLSSLPKMAEYNARLKASRPMLNRSMFSCKEFSTKVTMRDVIGFEEKKYLKETIDELEIKPTTTQIFVILQIQDIQQHINMPLLRLVHQFVTMVYCANDAREDIDNRRHIDWPTIYSRRHHKQNSKGSSNDTVTTGETTNSSNEAKHQDNYYLTLPTTTKSDSIKNTGKDEEYGLHPDAIVDADLEDIPVCWRQMYSLLDLYSRVPELKTVKQPSSSNNDFLNIGRRSFSLQTNTFNLSGIGGLHMPTIKEEVNETSTHHGSPGSLKPVSDNSHYRQGIKKHHSNDNKNAIPLSNQVGALKSYLNESRGSKGVDSTDRGQVAIQKFTFQWVHGERVPLVIFCSGKVKKMCLTAVLSELNLEGKLLNLHCSYSQKSFVKGRGMFTDKSSDHSFSLHCGELETVLFEEIPTQKLDVVHIKGSPSHFVFSSNRKKKSEKNSCFFGLGKFDIGLPHHPVKLKDMMQRSAKRISSTMTEFFRPHSTISNYHTHPQFWECGGSSGAGPPLDKSNDMGQPNFESVGFLVNAFNASQPYDAMDSKAPGPIIDHPNKNPVPLKQVHMIITGISKGLTISVALHQTLMARYQLDPVYMNGKIAVQDSKLNVYIKNHYLSFISENPPPGVPKSVSIKLPRISTQVSKKTSNGGKFLLNQGKLTQDLVTEEGSYIDILASVSTLEHTLTTSLLSYIVVTVQLFVKEINEVIQKMAGEDQLNINVENTDEFNKSFSVDNKLLNRAARGNTKFSFRVSMDGIRLIATTKSGAVKFETQQIDIELSNRVHSSHGELKFKTGSLDNRNRRLSDKHKKTENPMMASTNPICNEGSKESIFVFVIIENISVELGQLCKDTVYDEKPPDFKSLAFFKTGISLRSLLTEETALRSCTENREAYLISLIRPIFWIKPVAFDRGLLMWKLYQEELEKWKKTMTLHSQACTPSGSLPSHQSRSHTTLHQETPSSSSTGHGHSSYPSSVKNDILFLQLMIDDLGICIPLCTASNSCIDYDPRTNLVVTLKNARLSSCFKQDFASEGEFIDFCVRFDEEFNVGADDWKPDVQRFLVTSKQGKESLVVMNGCVVPNGTFQVCSKLKDGDIAKGLQVDVLWKMCGLDTHLDWNIGRRLKTLSTILTSMINLKDTNAETQSRNQSASPRMQNIRSDCILLQGQPTKLFDSPHEHINLNSLTEILDDTLDHGNYSVNHRKSIDLHKTKRNKLSQLFNKHNSVKRSFYGSYPSPPPRLSRKSNHSDFVDSRLESTLANSSTLRRDNTRQFISEEELSRSGKENQSFKGSDQGATRPSTLNITKKFSPSSVHRADSLYFDASEVISVESSYQDEFDEFIDASSNMQNSSVDDISITPVRIRHEHPPKQVSADKPNIESVIGIELKLNIHVDSGRCVLHPKISQGDNTTQTINKFMNPLDPLTDLRYNFNGTMSILNNEEEQLNALVKRYKDSLNYTQIASEISVFYIPAVSLLLFYNSKPQVQPSSLPVDAENKQIISNNKNKKSDLYAYILLKKLPKDLLVHPSLIDFVEQALEALPVLNDDMDFDKTSEGQSNDSEESSGLLTESLPVDVIVHINVEPSTLRFVCVPVSPVQCLMSLPSVDFIFTTKRSQLDVTPNKMSTPIIVSNSSNIIIDLGQKLQTQHLPDHAQLFAEGGLSVTCIMKEFKISVFHPYGNVVGPMDVNHSLTLAVQNVRINLCRMRQLTMLAEPSNPCDSMTTNNNIKISGICDIGCAEFRYDIRRTQEILAIPIAWYRSSLARRLFLGDEPVLVPPQTTEDVATTNFTDLPLQPHEINLSSRNINVFPSNIATNNDPPEPNDDLNKNRSDKIHHRRLSSGDKNKYGLPVDTSLTRMRPKFMNTPLSKEAQSKGNHTLNQSTLKSEDKQTLPKTSIKDSSKSCSLTTSTWQSLLLFAFNLDKVNFEMSMGSAMGITNFNLLKIYSRGHLMMDSAKSRNNQIKIGINEARFTSQSGIVGGEMGLSGLDVGLHVKEDSNSEPEHRFTGTVSHFEMRIEYMNTNILLSRISAVELSLHDEWQNSVVRQMTKTVDDKGSMHLASANSDQACVVILVQGEMKWDQCQFAIGRTTTPDLIKSSIKLTEYFTEQVRESQKSFLSSDRVGFNLRRTYDAAGDVSSRTEDTMDFICRVFQRHWQLPYNLAMNSFLRLPCYSEDSPEIHSILPPGCLNLGIVGGSLQLVGRSLGVACFAGNFKSAPDWAVFNIQYPTISFETEAQKMTDDKSSEITKSAENLTYNNFEDVINIRQVLSLELGRQPHFRPYMAYVVKVKRGKDYPSSNKIHPRIDEWFYFAFKPADNAIMHFLKFNNPQSESHNVLLTNFSVPSWKHSERPIPFKISNDADILFVIPSISSRLTTDHRQSMICPQTADESIDTEVKLSFHTDFHGVLQLGIIDVPWLPTLINSYIQEKVQDSVDCQDNRASTGSPIVKDMREYNIIHWCLSPECRWLQANQVSVPAFDQILKMVGFHKARTTIPKWLQRGVLDHLDNVLSILVSRVISLMQENVQSLKSVDDTLEHN